MADSLKNASKVLQNSANKKPAIVSSKKYENDTKWLISILAYIIKGPPLLSGFSLGNLFGVLSEARILAAYMDYHKVHLMMLDIVISVFDEFQPIKDELTNLEGNINNYRDDARKVAFNGGKLLSKNLYKGVGNNEQVILRGYSKSHPEFIRNWNIYLDTLKSSLKSASVVCDYISSQGGMIINDTKSKLAIIKQKLDGIQEEYVLEKVGKNRYKEKIIYIENILLPKVSKAKAEIEDLNKKIVVQQNQINSVQKIE